MKVGDDCQDESLKKSSFHTCWPPVEKEGRQMLAGTLILIMLTFFQPKEVLGIVAGQELPRRGRCQHYGKSYRWFRSVDTSFFPTCFSHTDSKQIQLLL